MEESRLNEGKLASFNAFLKDAYYFVMFACRFH